MHMKLSGDIDAQQGFTLEHGGYSKSQQEGNMKAKRYYIPPCTIRLASLPCVPLAAPSLLLYLQTIILDAILQFLSLSAQPQVLTAIMMAAAPLSMYLLPCTLRSGRQHTTKGVASRKV